MLQTLGIWASLGLGGLAGGFCCWFPILLTIWLIVDAQRSQRRLARTVAAATDEQKEEVLRLLAEAAPAKPTAFRLRPTDQSIDGDLTLICLPKELEKFPWAGRCVTVSRDEYGYTCSFVESPFERIAIRGCIYRLEGIPKRVTKKGRKVDVSYDPDLLKHSPELLAAVTKLYPESPGNFLAAILPKESPTDIQIGGSPSWLQSPEFPRCETCGRWMLLILQLSSADIFDKTSDTIYFFGCRLHPESTATVFQFT